MDETEKAFVIAAIQIKIKKDREKEEKARREARR